MSTREDQVKKLLTKVDATWEAFRESYAGLQVARLLEPGVVDDWSVKDILAHVTTWEEEALKHLPVIIAGGRPPRYVTTYGGIDAFNARMTERKRGLSLADIRGQLDDTHRQLIAFMNAPASQFTRETRARRRLRLDTYSHYPIHTQMIQEWRKQRHTGEGRSP